MEKVKLALNYALMLEMMKAKGFNNATIVALLNKGDEEILESNGEGIPTWKTLVDYYHLNKEKCHQALRGEYEISFLTKGALKSLLSIKFGMEEGKDFVDTGEFLDQVKITSENLEALREVMAKNWTIILQEENIDQDTQMIKIELTHKPVFNR
ncbi:hypothetical protein BACCIP111895_02041 [Neobacillus rhizosphaerae]|uniref:Uncharacterized protein n=1 Tax=Neobacillus rhizosphaerae TaxID=2880965 RepID=A0ABM9EQG6_9BACI|nr:hypothetical protein [Neobacillus rhizosphaerae]CAH2714865.1 hypothetical protein BACCIP111895_02041 [Neobacillus rhizosphaerae]